MADSQSTKTVPGFTRLQGDPTKNGGLSGIILRGSDGYDRALWVDTTGDLRIADVADVEASTFAPDSDGTIVGTQS